MSTSATVIVRTKDSARTLQAALTSIRAQDVPVEIIVVDSGSHDGTLAMAEAEADRVLHIAPQDFTYGGALNLGAAAASSDVHVALSSHCVMPRTDWVRRAVGHVERGAVGAAGFHLDPHGQPLGAPVDADHAMLRRYRQWGFSNHASAWSAAVWRTHSFDEGLPASEDKEWSWRATEAGGFITVDPLLFVPGDHRRKAGMRAYHRRLVKEWTSMEPGHRLPPYPLLDAAMDWGRVRPREPRLSRARRFGRTRLIEVVARRSAGR